MTPLKSSPVAHLLLTLVFFVSGLTINSLQIVFFAILWPVNKNLFRKINYSFTYIIFSEFVFISDWWAGVQYYFYAKKEDYEYFGKEHALSIVNHKYEIDWLCPWVIHDRIGNLGNCKSFTIDKFKYMPVVGWCWWFAEFVFLQRDWAKDQYTIGSKLKELFEYESPVSLLLFAEGTRFTKEKHEASTKFARAKGLPQLKEHMLPRTKGFNVGLPFIRNNLPAVYNVQLAFKGEEKPSLRALLNGRRFEAHVYIERIPIEQVPEGDEACEKWMYDMFEKKDKLMVSFFNTGDWFNESGFEPLEKFMPPRGYFSLLNVAFWTLFTLIPLFYIAFSVLMSGNFLHVALLLAPLCLFHVVRSNLINLTEISKSSSSYGTDKHKTE